MASASKRKFCLSTAFPILSLGLPSADNSPQFEGSGLTVHEWVKCILVHFAV
jgi:hypothetical protein